MSNRSVQYLNCLRHDCKINAQIGLTSTNQSANRVEFCPLNLVLFNGVFLVLENIDLSFLLLIPKLPGYDQSDLADSAMLI